MKLLLETCLEDLYISLVDENNQTIGFIHEEKLVKKSDELPILYERLLKNYKVKTSDITEIYITNGPGGFMGVRAGLIFASTLAQITGAKLLVCDTLKFASKAQGDFFFDAKGGESYKYDVSQDKSILVPFQENSLTNYIDITTDVASYLELFNQIEPSEVQCNYIKEPKIG